jgi:DNA-binding CsgD family transcriptional regulator
MRQQPDIPGAVNEAIRRARGPGPVAFDLVDVTGRDQVQRYENLIDEDPRTHGFRNGGVRAEFRLKPAQVRLAAPIHDRASVKQAVVKLGITEGSARQYLRRIFAKTGTNRQIDLIREIAWAAADDTSK